MLRYVWTIPTHRCIPSQSRIRGEKVYLMRSPSKSRNDLVRDRASGDAKARWISHQSTDGEESQLSPPRLSHLTATGEAHMVNIENKTVTRRSATAECSLLFSSPAAHNALIEANLKKGDALAVARIAGIQAAKKTADLIPLAHPGLGITAITIDIIPLPANPWLPRLNHNKNSSKPETAAGWMVKAPDLQHGTASDPEADTDSSNLPETIAKRIRSEHGGVYVQATVKCLGLTGVEMEALTAANVATLTMYDMLKGVDKAMLISGSRVIEKIGGKSGSWRWNRRHKTIQKIKSSTAGSGVKHDSIISIMEENAVADVKAEAGTGIEAEAEGGFFSSKSADTIEETESAEMIKSSASRQLYMSNLAVRDTHSPPREETPSVNHTKNEKSDGIVSENTDPDPDSDPQSILEAEWNTLSETFQDTDPNPSSTTQQLTSNDEQVQPPLLNESTSESSPNIASSESDLENIVRKSRTSPYTTTTSNFTHLRLRDVLSGNAHTMVDSRAFERARMERWEEWKRSR